MRPLGACLTLALAACGGGDDGVPDLGSPPALTQRAPRVNVAPPPVVTAGEINPRLLRRFRAIVVPPAPRTGPEALRVRLGKQLFFDKRLSLHRDLACATCHPLDHGGTDHLATSRGSHGIAAKRNAPTVFNVASHVALFWDGRAHTLEDQARLPILDPDAMAMRSPEAITAVLRAIPIYVDEFAAAFPGEAAPADFAHAATAIVAFERTLTTPSRWDRFLRGEASALSASEIAGLKLFADVGCVSCHTGELVGGSMFQRVGVARPWPAQGDQGRFALTHDDDDRMVFKVPSLRNVAITAPYFHDGRTASLADAVHMMAQHQLDIELTAAETASIVAWLGTLTGEPSAEAIAPPVLPPG